MLRSLQHVHHVSSPYNRSSLISSKPLSACNRRHLHVQCGNQLHASVAVRAIDSAAGELHASKPFTSCPVIAVTAADDGKDAPQQAMVSTPGRFSEAELRHLWDSVSRCLLKLGKPGVTEAHVRSLVELVGSHKLVKVQHNGARGDANRVAAAAADLHQQSAGAVELLQIKGTTMLFCSSLLNNEQLLAVAEAETASTAVWKTKRAAAAAERQQQRAMVESKKDASASKSRKRIGQLINTVAKPSKGPLDKSTLVQEWQQLASSISAEEAAGAEGRGQQKQRKAPWKNESHGRVQ